MPSLTQQKERERAAGRPTISNLKVGDTVCSTDARGTGYYRVVKVNRVTVDVIGENGNKVRAYPSMFDRKIDYVVPTLDAALSRAGEVEHG